MKIDKTPFFYVLVRSWNCFEYLDKCLESILSQTCQNFKILFIDDASDYTAQQKNHLKKLLRGQTAVFNSVRRYSVYNGYRMLHNYARTADSVTVILDGDDWFVSDRALEEIAQVYADKQVSMTWGDCNLWDGHEYVRESVQFRRQYFNTAYPDDVIKNNLYRYEPFRVSHPMTFKTKLFKSLNTECFKDSDGKWLKYCFDLAVYLPMLEITQGNFKVIDKLSSAYNIYSPNINIKKNPIEFARESIIIRRKLRYV